MLKGSLRPLLVAALSAGALFAVQPSPAGAAADTVKPGVLVWAWYFEQGQSESLELPGVGNFTVDTNNEYCPTQPGGGGAYLASETCAEGRLPVRIKQGDYKSPNQVSAVAFDTLAYILPGSKVHSFKATFIEAKAGCYKNKTSATGQRCETTDPVNVQGHELQACLITQIFGEGAARPYKERPNYECKNSDPKAKRREVKIKGKTEHLWTFNLTSFAKKWATGKLPTSSILITGAEPKDSGPDDSWRVVLVGAVDNGIKTNAKVTPPPGIVLPPDPPPEDGTETIYNPGTPGTAGTPGTPGTPGDTGSEENAPPAAAAPGEAQAPVDTEEEPANEQTAAEDKGQQGGLPGYAWLALLAGMIGFSLLRQTVLESATGIRPDGVLAQIQRLNAERRGGAPALLTETPGPLVAIGTLAGTVLSGTKSLGRNLAGAVGKVKGLVRKG